MRTRTLTVAISVLLLAEACLAAEFWEKKDYKNWSKAEAQRLLQNSPWSQQVTLSAVNVNVSQRNAASSLSRGSLGAPSAGRENVPQITYTVQLRSAPIVRQAVIRMSQIDLKYEKLTPDQRARFDAKAQSYIGGRDEEVVAYVTFDTNVPSYRSDLHSFWLRQTVDLLKSTTFLNAGGKKLPLIEFISTGDEAFQLIFARPADLKPDSGFNIEFQSTGPSGATEKILAEFKLNKMLVDGAPQF